MSSMNNVNFPDTGYENWDWRDSGEGGLFVYAVVRESKSTVKTECCVDAAPTLGNTSVCVSHPTGSWGPGDDLWRSHGKNEWEKTTESLLACVLLDTHWASLHQEGGSYFKATKDDLTEQGWKMVEMLSTLGEVELVTFLDT